MAEVVYSLPATKAQAIAQEGAEGTETIEDVIFLCSRCDLQRGDAYVADRYYGEDYGLFSVLEQQGRPRYSA